MSRVTICSTATLIVGMALGMFLGIHFLGSAAAEEHGVVTCPAASAKATPKPAAKIVVAPKAHPKATSIPNNYLVQVSGDQNHQTHTFIANGTFSVTWNVSEQDTSIGALDFSAELYDAQGNLLDLVVNSSNPTASSSAVHDDCSGGCYFKITALNATYAFLAYQ